MWGIHNITELAQLCGVAAILRYPCPGLEEEVEEDEEEEEEQKRSEELLQQGCFNGGMLVQGSDSSDSTA